MRWPFTIQRHLSCRRSRRQRAICTRRTAETFEDRCLLATFTVTSTANTGPGSLRQAISSANSNGGVNTIEFDLPPEDPGHLYYQDDGVAGQVTDGNAIPTTLADDAAIPDIDPDWPHSWFSIRPDTSLPGVGGLNIIDGYSQPGAVQNSSVDSFNGVLRIELDGSNMTNGFFVGGSNSVIRGIAVSRVASGYGIYSNSGNTKTFTGNLIGTDISGTLATGKNHGILIQSSANQIGGTEPALRNVVSGNAGTGIWLDNGSQGTKVQGNLIGVAADGSSPLGNGAGSLGGIHINLGTRDNVVGGPEAGAGNVIAFNRGHGVSDGDRNGQNNLIQGNRVRGNTRYGVVSVSDGARIIDNVVDANQEHGVAVSGDGQRIEANVITNNGLAGVQVVGGPVALVANSIHTNDGLGINLVGGTEDAFLVTANDNLDADTVGPYNNNLQNFPVITSATTGGPSTTITGTLHTEANASYRLEFFDNETSDDSGHGEGERYLGFADVTTDSSGNVAFSAIVPTGSDPSRSLTATATRLFDDDSDPQTPPVPLETSEFSAAWEVELGDVATFVNENWHFVSDVDGSGDLSFGDELRNDNDTTNPGTVTATYGKDGFGTITSGEFIGSLSGFDQINEAIALTQDGGTTTILDGTYAESISIDRNLTLAGGTGTAGDVVINPGSGDGVSVSGGLADVEIANLLVTGAAHGIVANGLVDTLRIDNVHSIDNSGSGFQLVGVGDVQAENVLATGNAKGMLLRGNSFSDTNGTYSSNAGHGVHLVDIAGDVTLDGTVIEDNSGTGNPGDGVHMNDGADDDSLAVAGNVTILAVTIRDTGAGADQQRRGVFIDGGVATGVMVEGGSTISGHLQQGVRILGETAMTAGVTFDDVIVRENGDHGIELDQSSTAPATLSDVVIENNGGRGITFPDGFLGDVVLTDVLSTGNQTGIFVSGAESFADTGGAYQRNRDHGIRLIDITADVTLNGTILEDNDADHDQIGNGLYGTSTSVDGAAIGGQLTMQAATIRDTDGAGDDARQITGVRIMRGVAGSITVNGGGTISGHDNYGFQLNGGDGVPVSGDVVFENVNASGNERGSGIAVGRPIGGAATFTDVIANSNGKAGILLWGAAEGGAGFSGVQASDNGATPTPQSRAGVYVRGASSFSDVDGVYQRNGRHGIELVDMAGDVNLTGTTLNDNALGGFNGNGLYLRSDENGPVVNGDVTIRGVTIHDSDGAGDAFHQNYGVAIKGYVTGVTTFAGIEDTDGNLLQGSSISGHATNGIWIYQPDAESLRHLKLSDLTVSQSGAAGIWVWDEALGDVSVSGLDASGNGGAGVAITGAGSFADSNGRYTSNDDHGISLRDIGGDVALVGTTLEDNDANHDGTGDGLSVRSTGSSGGSSPAVGGALLIRGATFRDTDGAGTQARQQRGIHILGSVAETVTVEGTLDSDGVLQPVVVSGHDEQGLLIEGHLFAAFNSPPLSGPLMLSQVVATENGDTGVQIGPNYTIASGPLVDGNVTLIDVVADQNGGYGVEIDGRVPGGGLIGGDTQFTDVQANANSKSGTRLAGGGSFSDDDGMYQNNKGHGMLLDFYGDVTLSGTVLKNNDQDNSGSSGLNLSGIGVGGGTSSLTVSDVVAENNGGSGFVLSRALEDLTLDNVALENNWDRGIRFFIGGIEGAAAFRNTNVALVDTELAIAGTLTLGENATLSLDPDSTVEAATMFLQPESTLSGTGTLTAPVVTGEGLVDPGMSPGELTFEADLVLTSEATSLIEIGGRGPGTDYDVLTVTGTATLGGTLEVVFVDGFEPEPGDAFDLITSAGVDREFDKVTVSGLPGGLTAEVVTSLSGVALVVTDNSAGDPDPDTACEDHPAGINLIDGVLFVIGTSGGDNVRVRTGSSDRIQARFNGQRRSFLSERIEAIVMCGRSGPDTLRVDDSITIPAILDGEGGSDTMYGGSGPDTLFGRGGDDRMEGGGGNDSMTGGAGNDDIDGEAGDDFVQAGSGLDHVDGGEGNDILLGSSGPDRIQGGSGSDLLDGGSGDDQLWGQYGRDLVIGGSDADRLSGGGDADLLIAANTSLNHDALATVLAEWNADRRHVTRVANIRGVNPTQPRNNNDNYLASASTVSDDQTRDIVAGEGGRDWLFAAQDDTLGELGPLDELDLL